MNETSESVNKFFESYRTAFERFDAAAIADHFAFPLHLTSDAEQIVLTSVATKQDWISQIERLLGTYRAIGVSSARAVDLTTSELSPRVVQAVLHWSLYDRSGGTLYDFAAIYTLVNINSSLQISAIAHNEAPRLLECVARLQARRA